MLKADDTRLRRGNLELHLLAITTDVSAPANAHGADPGSASSTPSPSSDQPGKLEPAIGRNDRACPGAPSDRPELTEEVTAPFLVKDEQHLVVRLLTFGNPGVDNQAIGGTEVYLLLGRELKNVKVSTFDSVKREDTTNRGGSALPADPPPGQLRDRELPVAEHG